MDLFSHLTLGFDAVFTLQNVWVCFLGCTVGTFIGILPGIGPMATIALLLPLTYGQPPLAALIMLSGIFYGAQYGGSTTAILLNMPGEASSAVTVIDGYALARQGRAGVALFAAAVGSFVAGCVGTTLLAVCAKPIAALALQFGPAEYFALVVVGATGAAVMSAGPLLPSLAMLILGLLLGMVGTDVHSGALRYTLGIAELADGIGFVSIAVGMFGIAEIILRLEAGSDEPPPDFQSVEMKAWVSLLRRITPSIFRGTMVGSVLGALPGCSPAVASFYAYIIERKSARNRDEFGHGAVEGVAAPESANNAAAQTAFIPLLALGLPSNGVMSLMIGAMTLHGIQPGPQIVDKMSDLFWGLVVSMWLGNVILLLLNLPLIRLWVAVLRIPYALLYPVLLLFCCIGAYSLSNSSFDILVTAGFGLFGYLVIKLGFEPAPLLLGYILGPMLEDNLRRTLLLSGGDFMVFVSRPIAACLLLVATLVIATTLCLRGCSQRQA